MKKKQALVTGAGRGIGLETARLFVENAIRTVIVDYDPNNLNASKEDFEQ